MWGNLLIIKVLYSWRAMETNYAQIAFKNLGIYDNHILSKDDCIKAYNYLQTLKAK